MCISYTGFGAHKLTAVANFLALLAQISQWMVSLRKETSEKLCIGAHLQSHGYKDLAEFYL